MGRRSATCAGWHTAGLGPSTLTDAAGNVTAVTVTVLSEQTTVGEGGPFPDLPSLMSDFAFDCSDPRVWSLDFSGLSDGLYRAIVYAAASDGIFGTGQISVDGSSIDSLTGVSPPALVQGASFGSAFALVSGGSLSVTGDGIWLACPAERPARLPRS